MAFSNTVSLSTNFNVDPYYDDFNESKQFHRILFRPGFGVQARELTQLQSMLQNQIDRFGEHIFREGSVVSGCEFSVNSPIPYVKLRDQNASAVSVNAIAFIGQTVTGGTNGVQANVFHAVTGSESNDPNLKTLFLQHVRSSANGSARYFANGEQLTASSLSANVATATETTNPVGFGSVFSVGEGVIFAKDHFIRVNPQKVILSRYSANATLRVGFTINETIVSSANDATLTDPARGSYNFAAPGANRLKLEPVLRVEPIANTATADFIEIAQFENGQLLSYKEKPQYATIRDYLAKRTFDESGNYTVRGLSVRLREHEKLNNNGGVFTAADGGSANSLSVDVEAGKAYVKGFDIEKLKTTHIQIDKGINFVDVEDVIVTNQYGNYVLVNEVSGTWDVNLHDTVNILSVPFNGVSNSSYSTVGQGGRAQIGTAKIRAITPETGTVGTPSAQYRLYLYDIQMSNAEFSSAKSFFYQSTSDADGIADAVLTGGNATINEGSFKKAVFPVGFGSVRRMKDSGGASDTDYEFNRAFTSLTIANSGIVTATSPNGDELFPFTALSTVSSPNEKFYLVFDEFANTVAYPGTVTRSSGTANTFSGSSTNFTDSLNIGDVIKVAGHGNTFTVSAITNDTSFNVLENSGAAITGKPFFKHFPVGKVVNLSGKGVGEGGGATAPTAGASRSVTIGSGSSSATLSLKEPLNSAAGATLVTVLNKSNGTQTSKLKRNSRLVQLATDTNLGGTSGPWCLGFPDIYQITSVRKKSSKFTAASQGTDVTNEFVLDNGQRDGFYDLGFLKLKSTSALTISSGDHLLVKLDYFRHDRSSGEGFLTVDSYPVNDTSSISNTEIRTENIPVYVSPTDGTKIDLRNALDFRPVVSATSNDVTVLVGSTLNPANTHTIDSTGITAGQGLRFPRPNENTTLDLSFYQARNDLIVMEPSGDVRAVRGTPSSDPKFPIEPAEAMSIGKVRVSPYPSLPPEQARRASREDLQSTIEPVKNKRFTMKDIGQISGRIDRLEYYTSLNLLEKSAKDLFIADGSGNDRFKNGILVDKFAGHGVGDVTNLDYSVSVDRSKSEVRPQVRTREVQLRFDSSGSTNTVIKPKDVRLTVTNGQTFSNGETVTAGAASGRLKYQVGNRLYLENVSGTFAVSATATGGTSTTTATISATQLPPAGKAITLPYSHKQFGRQRYATTSRNAAGQFYNYVGFVTLNPSTDYWIDTTRNPDVQVNFDLQNSNFLSTVNPFETEFAFDETLIFGSQTFTSGASITNNQQEVGNGGSVNDITLTTTQQTTQSGLDLSIGMNTQVVPFTDTQSIGDKVVDVNIIPFMRERLIQVTAEGFKPRTRLFAFFDGEAVSEYVTPTNSAFANTGSAGSPLITDTSGIAYAEFRIPNDNDLRFRVGDRRFRLTDSQTNSDKTGIVTTAGEAVYSAQGLQRTVENTIVSIESPQIVNDLVVNAEAFTEVVDTRTRTTTATVSVPAIPSVRNNNESDGGQPEPNPNDPIAQTFTVKDFSATGASAFLAMPGIYLSKIDLFFESKDATLGCFIEIREVDPTTSYITQKLLPFGRVRLTSADINTSTDGTSPTPVTFSTPVFLRNDIQYAIVVKPEGNNPNTRVFTARLGETDLDTGNRVTKQPAIGTLFASANDLQYTPIQEEDLKFTLYRASFSPTSGTVSFTNTNKEFFTVANASAQFTTAGEIVHGETTLTLGSTVTANADSEYANGSTSGANLVVRTTATGATNQINVLGASNNSLTPTPFTPTETIKFYYTANGSWTGQQATLTSQSTPVGRLDHYDPRTASNTFMFLSNTSGTFVANTKVRGAISGAQARIVSIDDFTVHRVNPHLESLTPLATVFTANAKFALTTSSLDTAFRQLNVNEAFDFDIKRLVMSRSNEATTLSGNKSAQILADMTTTIESLSPIVHLDRSTLSLTENRVNNDSTGEDGISGGNATSKYITKVVTLADGQDAEDLKAFVAAYKPSTGTVEVYYKILNESDEGPIDSRSWVQMTQVTSSATNSDDINKNDFKEYEFTAPTSAKTGGSGEVQYTVGGTTFTGFKRFAIKIVILTSDPANPPRLKDFRAIALQI